MQLMKSVARELAPRKIRANGIAPGAIRTAINRAAWSTPEAEVALLKLIPAGRVGSRKILLVPPPGFLPTPPIT